MGAGGNDANTGLSWAQRFLTLNGAEDEPVAAGDTCYVAPGVYREALTCDVSGGAGSPITYIGDVTGANTDGVGGIVRITGSDDDQSATRNYNIVGGGYNYRTFRGFWLDSAVFAGGYAQGTDWVLEDMVFSENGNNGFFAQGAAQLRYTYRRCLSWGNKYSALSFDNGSPVDNTGHVVENCLLIGGDSSGILANAIGGITVRNSFIYSVYRGINVQTALTAGQTVTVNQCILLVCQNGFWATAGGEITEDYNNLWNNGTDYVNTVPGAHSVSYPPLFQPPMLLNEFEYSWWMGKLSQWSALGSIAGTGVPTDDLFGITRAGAPSSWGPIEYTSAPARRDWDAGTSRGRRGS